MNERDQRLRDLLAEYREDGEVAVALILRVSGGTSYVGPNCSDDEAAEIFQAGADAFNKRTAQGKVLN